jgi:hypothetical protein
MGTRIGLVLLVVGLVAALAGWLWQAVAPTPDANIGAGLLVVLGLPVAAVGAIVLVVAQLARRRR